MSNRLKCFLIGLAGLFCDSSVMLALTAIVYRVLRRIFGFGVAEKYRETILALLGLPFYRLGGIKRLNFHCYGFGQRLRQVVGPFSPAKKLPNSRVIGPRRIGLITNVDPGCYPFLFRELPDGHILSVFSVNAVPFELEGERCVHEGFFDVGADYWVESKRLPLSEQYLAGVSELVRRVNETQCDLVLFFLAGHECIVDVATQLTAPCVVNISGGDMFPLCKAIDFTIYPVKYRFFPYRESGLYSVFSKHLVANSYCVVDGFFPYNIFYDGPVPSWRERESLMVWHGNLDKLNEPVFLNALSELLCGDKHLRLEIYGTGDYLSQIMSVFQERGVAEQVVYGGFVERSIQKAGEEDTIINKALRRARLAPSAFEMGGGTTRIEAYIMGAPSVHLRTASDEFTGKVHDGEPIADMPFVEVSVATANTVEEYLQLCRRCLYEESFAEQVAKDQLAVVDRVSHEEAWWKDTIGAYEQWLNRTGWAAGIGQVGSFSVGGEQ